MSTPVEPIVMRLCYVDGAFAYFTSRDLDRQWGDDWNDAPYEHNAGEPYLPHTSDEESWEIRRIAWDGPLETPAEIAGCNSRYSVEMINGGATAWLTTSSWSESQVSIPAGVTIDEFAQLVKKAGGTVYFAA